MRDLTLCFIVSELGIRSTLGLTAPENVTQRKGVTESTLRTTGSIQTLIGPPMTKFL